MNIKEIRTNLKITQEELAKSLDIDRSTVAKWETGEAMPRAEKLPKIAQILGCTVDDLLIDIR